MINSRHLDEIRFRDLRTAFGCRMVAPVRWRE